MSTSILAQQERSGPYRVRPSRLQAVLDEARALNLPIATIAPVDAASAATWLGQLGQALHFPAHFGANFDALYDCLCDREVMPQTAQLIVISQIGALGEAGSDTLIAVLQAAADEWREQGRSLWALFDVPGLDLDPLPAK